MRSTWHLDSYSNSALVSLAITGPALRQVKASAPTTRSRLNIFFWLCFTALVVYDYILTLKYEIDLLWRQKWSTAAWIFVLNRYLLLVYAVFALAPVSPQVSSFLGRSEGLLLMIVRIISCQ